MSNERPGYSPVVRQYRPLSEWPVYLANPRARAALTYLECGACRDWTR